MCGSSEDYDWIQDHEAQNVARATQDVGAKFVHPSAIGADVSGCWINDDNQSTSRVRRNRHADKFELEAHYC